ncbi:MAG: hypothetical protein KU37_04335 [Sulfuricurvum sp. PC08-66]|nr:MAG: hypothetical protein KU37_04335 [Sulfuricurvum sp. PC08-66]
MMHTLCKELAVLIVEDEAISTRYLADILRSLGCTHLFSATSMEGAVALAKQHRFDLVFMDINIEGPHDGITCAKRLNQLYFLPTIFTTAYGDSRTISEASQTNIFAYLIKPFEANDVEATLRIALKHLQKHKEPPQNSLRKEEIALGAGQTYSPSTMTFCIQDYPIALTQKELSILHLLATNLNNNISYETLKTFAWENPEIANSTIRDTVSRLKKKAPKLRIETIIGLGYVLVCP